MECVIFGNYIRGVLNFTDLLNLRAILNLMDSHWLYVKIVGAFSHTAICDINVKNGPIGMSWNPEMGKSVPTT